jgi:hypothetical protein
VACAEIRDWDHLPQEYATTAYHWYRIYADFHRPHRPDSYIDNLLNNLNWTVLQGQRTVRYRFLLKIS